MEAVTSCWFASISISKVYDDLLVDWTSFSLFEKNESNDKSNHNSQILKIVEGWLVQ